MSEQYYRVRVEWPIPHFMRDYIEATAHVTSIYDSRFYTTATELRQVHLDIQDFLSRNYAPAGLNEFEDLEDLPFKKSSEEILTLYGEVQQPTGYKIEEINDPEQVNLISQAIDQRDMVKSISQLMCFGLIPKPDSWKTPVFELGNHHHNLDRAIGEVLRPFHPSDTFDVLKTLVEYGDTLIREVQVHSHAVIQNAKGA